MASPFASLVVSDPIPLPFDDGQWIKVRKLTGRQHSEAQAAHRVRFVASNEKWAGFFRASMAHGPSSEEAQRVLNDPLTGYDRHELVRLGLVAWSYPQSITPVTVTSTVEGEPDRIEDAIEDLDDDALDFIAREVLKLTKPGLFVEATEESEAQKKSA